MKKFFAGVLFLFFLVACDRQDDVNFNQSRSFTSIATVQNPDLSSGFYFLLDNGDKMLVTATNFPSYRPKDGQRIIANYSILSINDNASSYNHKVALSNVYEVLTKGIFKIKPSTQDSIGNDQIEIRDMWIGSHFLNVEFVYPGNNKIHYINLVSDSTKTYTDGKVHLEFRHNANSDLPQFNRWGVVSFDISSLQSKAVGDSVKLLVHSKEFTTPADKTYAFTYKFGSTASLTTLLKKMEMPKNVDKTH